MHYCLFKTSSLNGETDSSLLFDDNNKEPLSSSGVKSQGWFSLCSHCVKCVLG